MKAGQIDADGIVLKDPVDVDLDEQQIQYRVVAAVTSTLVAWSLTLCRLCFCCMEGLAGSQ